MKSKFLFPSSFRPVGILLAIPGFILGYLSVYRQYAIKALEFKIYYKELFQDTAQENVQNFTDELALSLVIVGLSFIAFSRLKREDELTARLRLDALYWGMLMNYIIYFVAYAGCWLALKSGITNYDPFWGLGNIDLLIYNTFTPLLIFIFRFQYLISYKKETYLMPKLHYMPYYPFRLIGKWVSIICIGLILLRHLEVKFIETADQWIFYFVFLIPAGLLVWAYSKNADEDELIIQFRLESMQLAVYVNYGLLLVANLIIFGPSFYTVLDYCFISPLLFFVLRFSYVCNKNYWQVRRDVKGGLLS